MPQAIMEIAATYQKDAQLVKVTRKELTVPNIEQYYYEVRTKNKDEVLCRLLDLYAPRLSLVFCNTKKKVRCSWCWSCRIAVTLQKDCTET